ncbi:hypothetical protein HHK36_031702 [Tetracentron sinense]|uniref:Uncharacterized protein n=1 Tax=Tetracentron sinense TaxID=13715 RepID=A0A835D089_TETSI|nr:hypothetical protein HHK36_031702 [Tetracentron sinense]
MDLSTRVGACQRVLLWRRLLSNNDPKGSQDCSQRSSDPSTTTIELRNSIHGRGGYGNKALHLRDLKKREIYYAFRSAMKQDRLFEILEERVVKEGSQEQILEIAELAKMRKSERG